MPKREDSEPPVEDEAEKKSSQIGFATEVTEQSGDESRVNHI